MDKCLYVHRQPIYTHIQNTHVVESRIILRYDLTIWCLPSGVTLKSVGISEAVEISERQPNWPLLETLH